MPLIIANLKMHLTLSELETYIHALEASIGHTPVEVAIAPQIAALSTARSTLSSREIGLCAQNMSAYESGAYTGETSVRILCELQCRYVLLGHSERRSLYSETDDALRAKIALARAYHIRPILCVGEHLRDKESGKTLEILEHQIRRALGDTLADGDYDIAYEPIWAIGSGVTPTLGEIHTITTSLRSLVGEGGMRILYGGSVNESNIESIYRETGVDGFLVGGASLDAEGFGRMIEKMSIKNGV